MQAITTAEQFELEQSGYVDYATRGIRRIGKANVTQIQLQQQFESNEYAHILIYYCLDYSATHLLDRAGNDITPSYFSWPAPFEAELRSAAPGSETLLVASSMFDEGGTVCLEE